MAFALQHLVQAVDSHTCGEPTRLVTGGLPPVPGATMADKRDYLRRCHDHLRRGLVHEPRGHDAIVVGFLTAPTSADAAFGVVFANDVGYLGMCGHGAIGVAATVVGLGMVPVESPETVVRLDTPAGTVEARVAVADGGLAGPVTLRNVPAFLDRADVTVPVPGLGRVAADVAYGGNWFAIVAADQLDVAVEFDALPDLMAKAMAVRAALRDAGFFGFDPHSGEAQEIDHVEIYRTVAGDPRHTRTLTLCPGQAYDRSPCGTGTSAKMAAAFARGELAVGETFVNESVIGTAFRGRLLAEVDAGGRRGVVPEIEGEAFITGLPQFVFDPRDPLRFGIPEFAAQARCRRR